METLFPVPELSGDVTAYCSSCLTIAEAALGADMAMALAPYGERGAIMVAVCTKIKRLADAPVKIHDACLSFAIDPRLSLRLQN